MADIINFLFMNHDPLYNGARAFSDATCVVIRALGGVCNSYFA
ncbi:hypothetical protein [Skermania piniformis]|nr:hypothetical protein [Skermania piniformis]